MMHRTKAIGILLCMAALVACSAPHSPKADIHGAAPEKVRNRGATTIISGSELRVRGGSLLDALAGRVSNLRVDRRSGARCPVVSMRGFKTIIGNPNPVVYVDGTPMSDTCILTQLRIAEISWVEIYPSGLSHRGGYSSSANGLILVFLTGAGSPD